jgi:hypothetical protein
MFSKALQFNPHSLVIWKMYLKANPSLESKISICQKATESIFTVSDFQGEFKEERSQILLHMSLELLKLHCRSGHIDQAKAYLEKEIFPPDSGNEPSHGLRYLTDIDCCTLFVYYMYMIVYDDFPLSDSLRYPTTSHPFIAIHWKPIDLLLEKGETLNAAINNFLKLCKHRSLPSLLVPVFYNLVHFYLQHNMWEESRRACQRILKSDATLVRLWELYAEIEKVRERISFIHL